MRKPFLLTICLLVVAMFLVPGVAADYTSNFTNGESVHVNQSTVQDPTGGKAEPMVLWVLAGFTGLVLIALSLLKPRLYKMDYEISVIVSVLAWPFLWYWTWGSLTSIDYITGVAMTSVNGESVMITQHILYSFPILGYIGVAADVGAIFVTILLISQFGLFNEKEEGKDQKGGEE